LSATLAVRLATGDPSPFTRLTQFSPQFQVLLHFQRPTNDFEADRIVRHKESGLLTSGQSRRRHPQVAIIPSDRTFDRIGVNARNKYEKKDSGIRYSVALEADSLMERTLS
jgi:hypothetical protein